MLFLTRAARMFSYGFISVVLVLYLAGLGFGEGRIGLLLTLTLAGDTLVSLWITLHADRLGRKRMLLVGAALMVVAGVPFALSGNFLVLVLAATIGVISPSGNEVGPFLALEQAALAQVLPEQRRTAVFAWYNLAGSFATALGALAGGWAAQALQASGIAPVASYRVLVYAYSAMGLVLVALFARVSRAIEAPPSAVAAGRWGLHASRGVVLRLSALFSLDAFAGGFVIQSIMAYWLLLRFSISQMDVPTRQAYTMHVVAPDERAAAAGVTGIARTTGAAISPMLAGPLLAVPALIGVPFLLAGGLKILYDLLLYRSFQASDLGKKDGFPREESN